MENEENTRKMMIYKLEIENRYFDEKLKEEEKIKSIYHDMKNHILLLENGEEDFSKWMSDIKKKIGNYEDYYRTGNKFLNIILIDKMKKAGINDIKIVDDINLSEIKYLDPFDISTIFGNC